MIAVVRASAGRPFLASSKNIKIKPRQSHRSNVGAEICAPGSLHYGMSAEFKPDFVP
jgi:hypothetical protein